MSRRGSLQPERGGPGPARAARQRGRSRRAAQRAARLQPSLLHGRARGRQRGRQRRRHDHGAPTALAEDAEEAAYLKILRSQQVDGIILASAALHEINHPTALRASGYPFVFLGRYPLDELVPLRDPGVADVEGARQAVAHLLGHGHTRIAHISGPLATSLAADRLEGYRRALTAAGVTPRPEYCPEGDYSEEAGRVAMRALLQLPEPPTALFAANDETAVGASRRCARPAGSRARAFRWSASMMSCWPG